MSWSDYMKEHGTEEYAAWEAAVKPYTDRIAALEAALKAERERMDFLERFVVEARDADGKLVFGRAPGASPLRWYVDETREAIDLARRPA